MGCTATRVARVGEQCNHSLEKLPMNMAFGQTSLLRTGFLGRCPRLRCPKAFGLVADPNVIVYLGHRPRNATPIWPQAIHHRSLGHRPRNRTTPILAEGHA